MIGKAIYYNLSNDINVAGIVGTRIYQDMPPQDSAFPFIVYTLTNTQPLGTKDYNTKSVQDTLQIQIDMYSRKIVEISNLANYVRQVLDGYSGELFNLDIRRIAFTNDVSGNPDMEMGVYFRSQDYEIHLNITNS